MDISIINKRDLFKKLKKNGINLMVHYIPVHTQPYYKNKYGTSWGDCPNAEDYYQKCLSFPLFPAMKNSEVRKVINRTDFLTLTFDFFHQSKKSCNFGSKKICSNFSRNIGR